MKSFLRLAVLSCVAAEVAATHGGRQEIPEIETDVQSMTQQFAPAVTYTGPTEAHGSHYLTSSPTATPTPASYWLADIKHQGIAAFNPDPTYQVFRNVKDFGAKGELKN
jgi:glucan 1,3-beta-glucosidase